MIRSVTSRVFLTERDLSMMLMIYYYGGCAVHHLFQRFWPPSDKAYGPRNSCYRRIRQLVSAGYLQADRLPSLTGLGAGRHFLTLGPNGRKAVAEHLGLTRSELQRLRHIETPFHGSHHMALCSLRANLEIACQNCDLVELVEWISERELRKPPVLRVRDPRPPNELIPLIPDGDFRLGFHSGEEASLRLEMDMGTIPAKRMRARLRAYLTHARVDERPVLWVVPDQNRFNDLASWSRQEALELGADPTIFWVARAGAINSQSILGPIWSVVDGPIISLLPRGEASAEAGKGGL